MRRWNQYMSCLLAGVMIVSSVLPVSAADPLVREEQNVVTESSEETEIITEEPETNTDETTALLTETESMQEQASKQDTDMPVLVEPAQAELSLSKEQRIAQLKKNIGDLAVDTSDPWYVMEMAADGRGDDLLNREEFVEIAVDNIKAAVERNKATTVEKYIIALSVLNLDATCIRDGDQTYNAVQILSEMKLYDINDYAFALTAYDSGRYAIPENAYANRDEIVQEILNQRTSDNGWAYGGDIADPDMTAMVLQALQPYYFAEDATIAGITEARYQQVQEAVVTAMHMITKFQKEDGSFARPNSEPNSNTTSVMAVMLCSYGIDLETDTRFTGEDGSALDGLLKYALENNRGFGWKNNQEGNAMSTEQGFRALVSYVNMKVTGEPYNIYLREMSQSEKDQKKAQAVMNQIDRIGEVHLSSSALIQKVRAAYEKLSDVQKSLVSNVEVLIKAEQRLKYLQEQAKIVRVTNVSLNIGKVALETGKTLQLQKTVYPSNAANQQVIWSTSGAGIAEVDQNGRVTAKNPGNADIVVTTKDGGYKAVCHITVEKQKVQNIKALDVKLKTASKNIYKGKTFQLKVTCKPSNTTDQLKWKSSNKKVATVTSKGLVKGIKSGRATITVTASSGKYARCKIEVKEIKSTKVKIKKTLNLRKGKSYTLKARLTPKNTTDTLKWTSGNQKKASVSSKGRVKALKKGTVYIKVRTSSKKSDTCKVTIR